MHKPDRIVFLALKSLAVEIYFCYSVLVVGKIFLLGATVFQILKILEPGVLGISHTNGVAIFKSLVRHSARMKSPHYYPVLVGLVFSCNIIGS